MEFWEWCRGLRHAYRSSGVEEQRAKDCREAVHTYSSDSDSRSRGEDCVVPSRIGQGSKRSVACLLDTSKPEDSVSPREDISTKTAVVCVTESAKVHEGALSSEEDCMVTTAMSGPSPFDVAGDGSFPITFTSNVPCDDVENKDEGDVFLVGRPDDQESVEKKSSLYSKSRTFPTSRHEHVHPNKNCHVAQTCPPHGAKSVMGRRAKMEDTFVAIPDLIGVAFADSLNEIIPPRIADQIRQYSGRSLTASDPEESGLSHTDSMPVQNESRRVRCREEGERDGNMIEQIHFFGVFDGHGGADAAHHCQETMHERLKEAILSTYLGNKEVEDLGPNMVCSSEAFSRALAEAFRVTDEDFAKIGGESEELSLVGTTAVVALLSSQSMYVANAGDSRAVLYRNGKALALTDDHKAAREDETARVEAAGGQILFWNGVRVMGLLAVSRAIGDHSLRPYVIADPEVTVVNRHASDELLIMASDGLWDVISNQEACTLAKKCLLRAQQKGSSRENAARVAATVLTRAAVDRGSRDNVTVLVIDLMHDTDNFLHGDAMKMRLSEEIIPGRNLSSSEDVSDAVKSEDNGPSPSTESQNVVENGAISESDNDDPEMAPNYSFKSPFEMIDPPPNMTE